MSQFLGWNFFVPPRNYITHRYGGAHRSVYADMKANQLKEKSVKRISYILGKLLNLKQVNYI